jgi:hypothetical protein
MRIPENKIVRALLFFTIQLVSFFVLACNFRALAKGLYFWTALTDTVIVVQNMIVAKLMIENEKMRDWLAITAFSVGGACGSLLSIFVTKRVFGG